MKSDSDGRDSNLRGTARRARTLAHFTRAAGLARRYLPTLLPTPRRPSDAEPKDPLSRLRAGALQVWGNGGKARRLYPLQVH